MSGQRVERRLAAVMAADVAGYSRLMGADEEGTLAALRAIRREFSDPKISEHRGRIVKTTGDGILVEFASIVDAVRCAVELQRGMAERNEKVPADRRIALRIGINLGDVIIEDGDIFGDGVNVAARLEAFAEPGGICLSAAAHDQVRDRFDDVAFEDLGDQAFKNIARPVRAFRILSSPQTRPQEARLALPDKPSIAVLPFQNMGADPEQQYFADGLVEDLITNLSRLRWLFVIARNSSFAYKGQAIDVRQVGRELGVRYVLEGSVRRTPDRVRVTAQLIEAANGRHVWAERYDRGVEDIFAVQDEITAMISSTMEPEISAAERDRARLTPPRNLGAWELYQRGMWHLLRRNREDYEAARGFFRDAIALDRDFAAPHAGLAVSCFWLITHDFTDDPEATLAELAREAAMAVDLDGRDSLAHSAMGLAEMEMGRHDRAIAEHETATALNPNSSFSQWSFGYALVRADRNEEALEKFDLALRLNPRDPAAWSYQTLKAAALYHLGKYDEAAAAAQEAARVQLADVVWPLVHRATSLAQLGRSDEAARTVAELCARRPGLTIAAFRAWPHNRPRSPRSLDHIVEGLRKAGLPEA